MQDVSRIDDEEQRNKIRWQTKLGFEPIATSERDNILACRQISWDEYSVRHFRFFFFARAIPLLNSCVLAIPSPTKSTCERRRTTRINAPSDRWTW